MLKFEKEGDGVTCMFSGHIDTAESKQIEETVFEQIEGKSTVIFDLGDVDYICSAFLRICMKAVKMVGKDSFSIVKVQPPVKKIFKIANLDAMMSIE